MSRDLRVAMHLTADDKASAKVERLNKTVERGNKKVSDGAKRSSRDVRVSNDQIAKSHDQTTKAQERAAQRGMAASSRMYQDRQRLGIRSEERIRREIALTEAAYRRMAQSGRLSGQEQARAYQQMQQRVSSLRQELVATTRQQSVLGRGMAMGGRIIGGYQQVAGAAISAGYVMAQPIKRTMDYEQRLAYMANTAYAGEGLAGKKAGREELRRAVAEATKYGGSRDDAADALDTMIASGTMKKETAMSILPGLQKAAIATGATTSEMGSIAVRAMQNFKIAESDIPLMLDIAAKAGEAGGFEIRDMAKWLPELMAAGSTSGMSGLEGFKTLVTAAQTSLITAGSTDAAGNNLKNLLLKLNSRDTALAAAKIEIAPGKSIDLGKSLSEANGKGINSLDAFVGIVDQVVSGNKEYQELNKKIAESENKSPEQLAAMEAQAALLQGTSIGKLIQDQQALLALIGYMNNREYAKNIKADTDQAEGTNEENYNSVADTAKNKTEKFNNERENAEYEAYQKLTASVGDAALKLADYAAQYPSLTQFMVVAKDALNALALAAGAAAAVGALRGGVLPIPNKGGGPRKTPGPTSGQSSKSVGASGMAKALVVGAPVAYGAMDAYNVSKSNLSSDEKATAYTDIAVSTTAQAGGGFLGLKGGAAMGSFLGPWGAAIGGAIGAVAGSTGMDWAATELKEVIRAWNEKSPEELAQEQLEREKKQFAPRLGSSGDTPSLLSLLNAPSAAEQLTPDQLSGILQHVVETGVQSAVEKARQVPQELKITTTVDVKNGNITAEVNALNSREARRN